MKKQLLTNEQCKLHIGPYAVHIHNGLHHEAYHLHENAAYFLEDNEDNYSDAEIEIHYNIQPQQDFIEPSDQVVARFDKGPIPYRIYHRVSGDYIWVRGDKAGKVKLAFEISSDWSAWRLLADYSATNGMDSFQELAFIFSYSILNKHGLMFHGVIMEWQENGILVCAHSGVGKTTHTRMWRDEEGARIINGDRGLCCKDGDTWYTYGAPWCGSSGEFMNKKIELKMIVILEQAMDNKVVHLSPIKGALELIQLAFAPTWEKELMDCCLASIDDIVMNIPIVKLSCTPDLRAVEALKKEVIRLNKIIN